MIIEIANKSAAKYPKSQRVLAAKDDRAALYAFITWCDDRNYKTSQEKEILCKVRSMVTGSHRGKEINDILSMFSY